MTRRKTFLSLLLIDLLMVISIQDAAAGEAVAGKVDLKNSVHSHGVSGMYTERQYTMTVRVRPLLFWISRTGIGGGRIAWGQEVDGRQRIELLIGSDPTRTPMRINRWGYIVENADRTTSELVGIMTASDEQSIEQARESTTRQNKSQLYKAIRSNSAGGQARSMITSLTFGDDFTYQDASRLILCIPQSGSSTRQIPVPAGTEPGFLFALKGLIHRSVEKFCQSGKIDTDWPNHRRYVYDATLFELQLKSSRSLLEAPGNACRYQALIEGDFETRNLSTGKICCFKIVYGTRPPIAETPVRIVYRPRWWFQVELMMEDAMELAQTAKGGMPWNPGSQ